MGQILEPLEPLKNEDMPPKLGPNWKLWGPGAILVGLSIGAGEIIIWPRIVAEFGASMVWAAVVGVFLQMWINFEVGRWTIATGETVFTGYSRVWRGFGLVFILFTILGWLAPGWGRASGSALKALLVGPDGWGSDTFWTVITFVGAALVLFGPKLIYKSVERTVEVLVILITAGLILVAVVVGSAQDWGDLGKGMVNFGHFESAGKRRLLTPEVTQAVNVEETLNANQFPDVVRVGMENTLDLSDDQKAGLKGKVTVAPRTEGEGWVITAGPDEYELYLLHGGLVAVTPPLSVKALFIALVFAGAGGTANLFYTFYLRDKHIGMGAKMPSMQNPLRGRAEAVPATGFRFNETDENIGRFRAWWRFIRQDQMLFFWGLNSITMLLFIFGALAVLHPDGNVPGKGSLIWDEAEVLGQQWGTAGRYIFLIVGMATLFTTQLTLIDGSARTIADIVYTNVKTAQKRDVGWWYFVIAISWMVLACLITLVMEQQGVTDLGFLFSAAYMGGFAMAVYVPLTLYLNLKHLPKSAKPGPVSLVMMIIASCVYVGFAVACILWEFGILKEG